MRQPLSAMEKGQLDYDYIVISHNGKCAERLMREVMCLHVHVYYNKYMLSQVKVVTSKSCNDSTATMIFLTLTL